MFALNILPYQVGVSTCTEIDILQYLDIIKDISLMSSVIWFDYGWKTQIVVHIHFQLWFCDEEVRNEMINKELEEPFSHFKITIIIDQVFLIQKLNLSGVN